MGLVALLAIIAVQVTCKRLTTLGPCMQQLGTGVLALLGIMATKSWAS